MELHERLEKLGVCNSAFEWATQFPSFTKAWNACERPDWMLWLAIGVGIDRKLIAEADSTKDMTRKEHTEIIRKLIPARMILSAWKGR